MKIRFLLKTLNRTLYSKFPNTKKNSGRTEKTISVRPLFNCNIAVSLSQVAGAMNCQRTLPLSNGNGRYGSIPFLTVSSSSPYRRLLFPSGMQMSTKSFSSRLIHRHAHGSTSLLISSQAYTTEKWCRISSPTPLIIN